MFLDETSPIGRESRLHQTSASGSRQSPIRSSVRAASSSPPATGVSPATAPSAATASIRPFLNGLPQSSPAGLNFSSYQTLLAQQLRQTENLRELQARATERRIWSVAEEIEKKNKPTKSGENSD